MNATMMRRLALVITPLLLLTACGDDDDATTSEGGSESSDQTSGDAIKIFQVSSYSDPNFAIPEHEDGSRAAVDFINASGGIDGRPLELETCNGGLDPNQSASCVQEGIDSGAIAFVGGFTLYGGPTFDALTAANIPWVCGLGVNAQEQTDPLSFPCQGGSVGQSFGQAHLLVNELGLSRIGVITDDSVGGDFNGGLMADAIEAHGAELTELVRYPIGSTDKTGPVNQLLEDDPEAFMLQSATADSVAIIRAARQAGFEGPIVDIANVMPLSTIEQLGEEAEPLYISSNFRLGWLEDGFEPGQQFLDSIQEVNSDVELSAFAMHGWQSVTVFAQVMADFGEGDFTSQGVIDAFERADAVETAGLTPTLDFTNTNSIPGSERAITAEVVLYEASDGTLVPLSDGFVDPLP